MVSDIIVHSWAIRQGRAEVGITMSVAVVESANRLRDFLFREVYDLHFARQQLEEARQTVRRLYQHYLGHPEVLPEEYRSLSATAEQRVTDYISGMTDQFAQQTAGSLNQ
jgi:dGTPase